MQKITLCLCYDHQAEEAVHFYLSVFKQRACSTSRAVAKTNRAARRAAYAPSPLSYLARSTWR
ncbi:MAG TPA: VOC family protein [Gammaproteobacteria bacterium]